LLDAAKTSLAAAPNPSGCRSVVVDQADVDVLDTHRV
jgi:hypothetical protein